MIELSSAQIKEILGYDGPVAEARIKEVSTDSRQVDAHTLFIALKGEKFDGHDFVAEVVQKGCPLVIAEREIPAVAADKVIVVKDCLKAFGKLAQYNRRCYKGTVIALTGSSGKTTTKEELKAALSVYAPTYATSGNFNNFVGVPRSLLDIDMNSRYAVIEMGMSALKEIEYLVSLTEPDVAVVTNVFPMHIEFLKTIDNIATAKAEIFSGLNKGIAVYNEDSLSHEILEREAQKYATKIYRFGKAHHSPLPLCLAEEGEHHLYNAWCVLAVLEALGLDGEKALPVLNNFGALEGRGKKHHLTLNGKKILLIDDSYSGQPDAMKLAIRTLAKTPVPPHGRRIALIGKMAELGDYTVQAHREVGQLLRQEHIDVVIGVCPETKDILAELAPETEKYYFDKSDEVTDFLLKTVLRDGDVLLIKGAHYSSAVYKVAAKLIAG
jgi:UDP-N-acetylmuramoyl-tripeptide--D-alanyl-D-alanine ligase